jgi:hypothetical protein
MATKEFTPPPGGISKEDFNKTSTRGKLKKYIDMFNNAHFKEFTQDFPKDGVLSDAKSQGIGVAFYATAFAAEGAARGGLNVRLVGQEKGKPLWVARRAKGLKIVKAKKLLAYKLEPKAPGGWEYAGDGSNVENMTLLMTTHVKAKNFVIIESPVPPNVARDILEDISGTLNTKLLAKILKGKVVKTVGAVPLKYDPKEKRDVVSQ